MNSERSVKAKKCLRCKKQQYTVRMLYSEDKGYRALRRTWYST